MSFLQELINQFKGWSTSEWSLFATCFIELAVILFYNKGALKCKEHLEQYESELKTANANCARLQEVLEERGEA